MCNTLNVGVIPSGRAAELVPAFLAALDAVAARLGTDAVVHVERDSQKWASDDLFEPRERVRRAPGHLDATSLGTEWEWERSPEVSLVIVDDVDQAVELANRYSPQFVVSVITDDRAEFERCYSSLDAPFVGNGFTRWVDGQYALDRPELGLANWQGGRLLGRGAILSGDSVAHDPLRGRHHRHDHPSVTTCHVGAWHRRDRCRSGLDRLLAGDRGVPARTLAADR